MSQYRKKPVVIEAAQWFKDGDHPAVVRKSDPNRYADEGIPWVPTLEGGHVVTPGDWIITGIKGEHYPCKDDIFRMTYEDAEQAQPERLTEHRGVTPTAVTSLDKFNAAPEMATETPLERLRYFLSHALNGQDWLDVEPFLDAIGVLGTPAAEAVAELDKLQWREAGDWHHREKTYRKIDVDRIAAKLAAGVKEGGNG